MKNNAFEGNGIFYFNNGNKYVGEFKNFKAEKKYGKKLINVLRRRNDNKKD